MPDLSCRSYELERLDTGDYTPEEYAKWLKEMHWINRLLGDTRALRNSLGEVLNGGNEHISILDVGAGSGELLKSASEFMGDRIGLLVGAELNADAARAIQGRAAEFGVAGLQCDAMRLPFGNSSFDVVISSLFLHHLPEDAGISLLREMSRVARRRIILIDLHRHLTAYYLYRAMGSILLQRFTVEDGSLSILRSFVPRELHDLAKAAGLAEFDVKRSFPFRLVLSAKPEILLNA